MTHPDEKLLLEFLTDWLAWATSGAPDGHPYNRKYGLCTGALVYENFNQLPVEKSFDIRSFLQRALASESAYPFGMTNYLERSRDATQHLDSLRLDWVRQYIADHALESKP